MEEEEEGEVDENVRNLTDEERDKLGKLLENEWKTVALKLRFSKDEVTYFKLCFCI